MTWLDAFMFLATLVFIGWVFGIIVFAAILIQDLAISILDRFSDS